MLANLEAISDPGAISTPATTTPIKRAAGEESLLLLASRRPCCGHVSAREAAPVLAELAYGALASLQIVMSLEVALDWKDSKAEAPSRI